MSEKLIVSYSCTECDSGKFHIFQIENDLHVLCCSCGHVINAEEIIKQIKNAKTILEK